MPIDLLPATGFSELIGDPFGRWVRGHPKPQDLPSAMAHDQQTIEQSERDCRHDEEVHCDNAIRMVAKERLPSLRGRAPPPRHILGDAGLADLDAELDKLSMDSHSGLAMLIPRISRRISNGTVGRPQRCRDFRRQYDLKPARCQRMTVSGFTIVSALMVFGPKRYSPTMIRRSMALKATLFGTCRRWMLS